MPVPVPGASPRRAVRRAGPASLALGATLAACAAAPPRPPPRPPPPAAPMPDGLDRARPLLAVREGRAAGLAYLETVVGAVDPEAPLPLVLALHGLADRPHPIDAAFWGTPDPCRVVQPRAPTPFGDGFTWLPGRVAETRADVLADGARRASARLVRFLDAILATRPTRGLPVVTGFSQGGVMTFTLAALYPDRLGAALPVAGWLPPPLWPSGRPAAVPPPIRSMHGDVDRVVPLAPTRRAVAHLRAVGFDVALEEVPGVGHELTEAMGARLATWLAASVRREWLRAGPERLTAPTVPPFPPGRRGLDNFTDRVAFALQPPYTEASWPSASSKP